jgi:flagellar protein FlaJ
MKLKLANKESSVKPKRVDEQIVYFITFLFSISTGELSPSELIKTASSAGYGFYSEAFKNVFSMGMGWKYGFSRACEMVGMRLAGMKETHLSLLLVKFAQVIRLGDDLRSFLKGELDATIHSYSNTYERSIESLKLLLGMYSTLMSTAAFMIAASGILTMLMGQASNSVLLISTFAVILSLSAFVFMMYRIFPRDMLMNESGGHLKKLKTRIYLAIAMGAGLGIALFLTNLIPPVLVLAVAAAPLFLPGLYARKVDGTTRKLDDWYPTFVKHFGEVYATVGSMGQALSAVLRSDFGPLGKHLQGMHNRIQNRTQVEDAFDLLSKESGSAVVTAGNTVLAKSIVKGANMNEAGTILSEVTSALNELKRKRLQTAKAFESSILMLHVLTLVVFAFLAKITSLFSELFEQMKGAQNSIVITPIDPSIMSFILPVVILSLSGINAMAIKVSQGGLMKTVLFYAGLLCVIGSVVVYSSDIFLGEMLSGMMEFTQITDLQARGTP